LERVYLGVDGGQSSTTALIADGNGNVVGMGKGGPCNHVSSAEGRGRFFRAIGACIQQACNAAGLNHSTLIFESACLGFSGGPKDKDQYSRELIRSRRFKITHDAEIALSGATAGEPGIIIIAGTGSMAFGRNAAGKTARAGGWGYVFGDEGGGFDLTRRALRAALRFEEGWGPPTSLHRSLREATGAPDINDLMHQFYSPKFTRAEISAMSEMVSQAAASGDAVASEILRAAAADLCFYVQGVHGNLFSATQKPRVAYIGGVFKSPPLLAEFRTLVSDRLGCPVEPPRLSPAAGALLEALRADGNGSALADVPESEK
jgi:N-acetylglucosamine kinase-like BadF-type ATPase